MLRGVGRRAGDQHAEVGRLTERRPHLLAVDDPLVAVQLRPGGEPGQVRARPRLAEQLAPGRPAGDDVQDQRVDLLGGAVVGDRRSGQQQSEAVGGADDARGGDLVGHLHPDTPGQTPTERVGGQRRGRPSRGAEAFPPRGHGQVGIPGAAEPRPQLGEQFVGVGGLGQRVGHAGSLLAMGTRTGVTPPR